jgi:hypothetical protein
VASLLDAGTVLYSYRFEGVGDGDYTLMFAVHDVPAEQACNRYSPEHSSSNDSFWFVSADILTNKPGVFAIEAAQLPLAAPRAIALLDLSRREYETTVKTYPALGGQLSLANAPTPAQAEGGALLAGQVSAEFPLRNAAQGRCAGGVSSDGAGLPTLCECIGSDGEQWQCEPSDSQHFCCYDYTGARRVHRADFKAAFCPKMCRYRADLPNLCAKSFSEF